MVTGLAELLRYSLASDRTDSVALGDELRVVDAVYWTSSGCGSRID